jgi:hypothetical protein
MGKLYGSDLRGNGLQEGAGLQRTIQIRHFLPAGRTKPVHFVLADVA